MQIALLKSVSSLNRVSFLSPHLIITTHFLWMSRKRSIRSQHMGTYTRSRIGSGTSTTANQHFSAIKPNRKASSALVAASDAALCLVAIVSISNEILYFVLPRLTGFQWRTLIKYNCKPHAHQKAFLSWVYCEVWYICVCVCVAQYLSVNKEKKTRSASAFYK